MNPGEIWIGRFPYGGSAGGKLRPVLVLTGPVGAVPEFSTAYISSVVPDALLPSDLLLDPAVPEHASVNLKLRSVVRLHKLFTVHRRDLVRRLGVIGPELDSAVKTALRSLLNL